MRLVHSEPQVASLREVYEYYSYLDLLKAHEVLNMKEAMKNEQINKIENMDNP